MLEEGTGGRVTGLIPALRGMWESWRMRGTAREAERTSVEARFGPSVWEKVADVPEETMPSGLPLTESAPERAARQPER